MNSPIKELLKLKSWQEKLIQTKKPVLLYGMGDGADKLIPVLNGLGIEIRGVFASDGFVRGQVFRGWRVMSVEEARKAYGDFVAVPAFALHGDDCKTFLNFGNDLIAPNMPVCGEEICDRDFIEANIEAFSYVYDTLADEKSREVMKSVLSFNISGDIRYLFTTPPEKYRFYPHPYAHVDAGAYDGDTVLEYLAETYNTGKVFAIEPDPKSFSKLVTNTADIKNVVRLNKAAWSKCEKGTIAKGRGRGSSLDSAGSEVELISIDSLGAHIGSIKIDCEGSDAEVLYGAVNTICENRPQIAAAVYHRAGDIFAIPRIIRYYHNDYEIYMRKIDYIPPWDIFCFAK